MRSTRERLIDVAAELVDQGGAAAVTLREVGTRAGLSHNAPYKHFSDKQDLLASVAAAELDTLAQQMRGAAAGHSTGRAKVHACALTYVHWAQAHPTRFKLTFGPWGDVPHAELGHAAEAATQVIHECVGVAIDDGTLIGDASYITTLVWALGHGAIDLSLAGHLRKKPNSPTPEDLVGHLLTRLAG
ncbi:TetR/AcrR family transcriptional regulator [Phytoactinopolyspora halophila]|nr:TetR/AcrR family transcriptional regulator [Phytoactinopolyspora halophila]